MDNIQYMADIQVYKCRLKEQVNNPILVKTWKFHFWGMFIKDVLKLLYSKFSLMKEMINTHVDNNSVVKILSRCIWLPSLKI